MRVVSGWVKLPSEVIPMPSAKIHVWVEDVSRVDGLARTVAKQVISGIQEDNIESGAVQFKIPIADADRLEDLALRVHLDVDGDGIVSIGDYVSTMRILISSSRDIETITIPIQLVG